MRTAEQHAEHEQEIKSATTVTRRRELETRYGMRPSLLSELSYFDVVKMHTIDPMHNLFLGNCGTYFLICIVLDLSSFLRDVYT